MNMEMAWKEACNINATGRWGRNVSKTLGENPHKTNQPKNPKAFSI